MQNNCNPLIPWKTFLMRKIWRFSAPSKRNLGLVVPGADVAVPGLRLWFLGILDSGHLSSSSSSTFRRRQRQREGKESSEEEGWVCGVFTGRNCYFVWICAVPAWLQLRDATSSPPHQLTPASPRACTCKHRPCVLTPKADSRARPRGYVSASTE